MNASKDEDIALMVRKYNISDEEGFRSTLWSCELMSIPERQKETLREIKKLEGAINVITDHLVELDTIFSKICMKEMILQEEKDMFFEGIHALRNIYSDLPLNKGKRTPGRPSKFFEKAAARLLINYWTNQLKRDFKPNFPSVGNGTYISKSKSDAPESKSAEFIVDAIQFLAKHADLPPEQPRNIPSVGSVRKIVESVRKDHVPETTAAAKVKKLPKIIE